MEILKTANEWAKAEIFSSTFFILFGLMFVAASIGFWQIGKTEVAKAFIFPTLVAGGLLLTIGIGLVYTNKVRISSFETDYNQDAAAFVQSEIDRSDKTIAEYQRIVFKVIPFIIVAAALCIVFIDKPIWRAIGITTIAMMAVILLIDSNASKRMEEYKVQLELFEKN
ncbi:MAG: hypothetical protein AAF206_12465 [Bacteroidota bacterium]